ncbi:MAG: DUF2062 domain-containing protein [Flavobacteriales bacterium]|nr:DUF2062 domain-containing protein [Flavobacteriales bacterium]
MNQKEEHSTRFNQLKCCVLIPTYNNEKTLKSVVESCKKYTSNILVVNDGSTDSTADILALIDNIEVLSYSPNKGKGNAMKAGFRKAEELGYEYAITIDSDGQHLAKDLPKFLDKIEKEPGSIIVGARNMDQAHIPEGSQFGHKFSNFWYWAETGIRLPDTQSGYRLYPVKLMNKMRFITGRYEFEAENIVKAAWRRVNVTSVPVDVIYQEGDERVTHFRKWDFYRFSFLNTYLFTLALLIYHPIRLIRGINAKNLKRIYKDEILASNESNAVKSLSVAFGFFMGIIPLWGFQFVLAIMGAVAMKWNKVIVGLTAQISILPLIPFVLIFSKMTGEVCFGTFTSFSETLSEAHNLANNFNENGFDAFSGFLIEYLVGAVVLSCAMAIVTGFTTFLLLTLFRKEKTVASNG